MPEQGIIPRQVDVGMARAVGPGTRARAQGTSLADLLDRVVHRGVVVSGDVIIQLAGIDLIRLDLRLLLIGIERAQQSMRGQEANGSSEAPPEAHCEAYPEAHPGGGGST
jgi:hypothetical protein